MEQQMENLEQQFRKRKSMNKWDTLYRCLFFLAFFLALLIANTAWKSEMAWVGFLGENSMLSYQGNGTAGMTLWRELLRQRVIDWCFLVLFSATLPGMWYGAVLTVWQGFSMGFFFVSELARYSIRGMSVFFCICFPQWILYLMAIFCMLKLMTWYRERCIMYGNEKRGRYRGCCVLLSAVYVVGILLEYYVNPYFLSLAGTMVDV